MIRTHQVLSALVVASVVTGCAQAQKDPLFDEAPSKKGKFYEVMEFSAAVEPKEARRGQTVTFKITLKPSGGYHTYPTQQPANTVNSASVNDFKFKNDKAIVWVASLREPTPKEVPQGGGKVQLEYDSEATFVRSFVVRPDAPPGKTTIRATGLILACDKSGCLPPEELTFEAPLQILEGSQPVDVEFAKEVEAALKAPSPAVRAPNDAANGAVQPKTEPEKTGVRAEMPKTSQELVDFYKSLLPNLIRGDAASQADSGLWAFMLAGVFWGAVSLFTPCVFPMIPITVTFFIKQAEKEHHKPLTLALVYCGTIVIVLTIAAMVLLSAFRAASVNPLTNILIGILFIFFTLSLFGMFEIELSSKWQLAFFLLFFSGLFGIIAFESREAGLPSPLWQIVLGAIALFDLAALGFLFLRPGDINLASYTAARQDQGGIVGTVFMALTFTIISFACVAPFLGAFGGTAAGSTITFGHRLLGGLAFSITFASPFFLLALFPSVLKKLPRSGSWMNIIKVVMGFLELAAALKFLRQGELMLRPVPLWFTFDLVLALWIGLCILCALYLLNLYRLPHDTPAEHLSVPSLLLAIIFLGLAVYLLPALFRVDADGAKQRPSGSVYAWLDSFLLPDGTQSELPWTGNLQLALERAREQKRLVFVDFTGKTCVNCKKNEENIFPKKDVVAALRKYELVQLYTDFVPDWFYPPAVRSGFKGAIDRQVDDARKGNLKFQREAAFGTEQLPLYVILEPVADGKVLIRGVYAEGLINDEAAFLRFLQEPLERNGQLAAR